MLFVPASFYLTTKHSLPRSRHPRWLWHSIKHDNSSRINQLSCSNPVVSYHLIKSQCHHWFVTHILLKAGQEEKDFDARTTWVPVRKSSHSPTIVLWQTSCWNLIQFVCFRLPSYQLTIDLTQVCFHGTMSHCVSLIGLVCFCLVLIFIECLNSGLNEEDVVYFFMAVNSVRREILCCVEDFVDGFQKKCKKCSPSTHTASVGTTLELYKQPEMFLQTFRWSWLPLFNI